MAKPSIRQGETAVINIGSNSVKLLIPDLGRFGYRNVITSRLAANSTNEGKTLDLGSVERTFGALKKLKEDARSKGALNIHVYATEALRKADNKRLLTDRIRDELMLETDIISGEQEAKIAALGASLSFPSHDAFADIGGASTEIALKRSGELLCSSFSVGAVRLNEIGTDISRLKQRAAAAIETNGTTKHIVGIGGTFSALACVSLDLSVFDASAVHGTIISVEELDRLREILQPLEAEETARRFPALKLSRAQVIKAGLAIALAVTEKLNADDITVSMDDGLKGYAMFIEENGHI